MYITTFATFIEFLIRFSLVFARFSLDFRWFFAGFSLVFVGYLTIVGHFHIVRNHQNTVPEALEHRSKAAGTIFLYAKA